MTSQSQFDSLSPQGQYVGGQGKPSLARRRYQKGVLELRGNTWTVKFREDMIPPDGGTVKRVEVRRFVGTLDEFPTRKLARRRADEIVSRVNGLDYKPIMVATFAEYSEVWKSRALAMMKPSTQKAARAHLRIYLIPQFGQLRLDEIGISAVQSLVARMAANNLSRHMIMNVLYTLSSALKSGRKWGYLCGEFRVADLTIPAGGIAKVPRFFTLAEAIAIIDATENPWRTIFAVAAMTGMRPGEVLGLAVGDLDFERRLIHVRQTAYYSKLQTPKSRSSVAPVPMPDPLAGMLREYLETWKPNAAGLLFATRKGTPFCENKVVQKRLWPILDKLKIPRCGMHAFRHMYASLLVQGGASPAVAQRQLRHSDVMTTMRHYAHILGSEQRDAAERIAAQLLPVATNATNVPAQGQWLH